MPSPSIRQRIFGPQRWDQDIEVQSSNWMRKRVSGYGMQRLITYPGTTCEALRPKQCMLLRKKAVAWDSGLGAQLVEARTKNPKFRIPDPACGIGMTIRLGLSCQLVHEAEMARVCRFTLPVLQHI